MGRMTSLTDVTSRSSLEVNSQINKIYKFVITVYLLTVKDFPVIRFEVHLADCM